MERFEKFVGHASRVFKENGIFYFLKAALRFIWMNTAVSIYIRLCALEQRLRPTGEFIFRRSHYAYFIHPYNTTWRNERSVEIPIVMRKIDNSGGKRILEVGDVLNHYFPFPHDVLDKYTEVENIMNVDIVDFYPKDTYDVIVSVSTIEHVGWDEAVRERDKIERAIRRLVSCLSPGGQLIVTVPLGYNLYLDRLLENRQLVFDEVFFLKRISRDNEWREVSYDEVRNSTYGNPFHAANAIAVGYSRGKDVK